MKETKLKSKESLIDKEDPPNKNGGLISAIKLHGFRKLWIGQIFSQLADKFYIVLMVYLLDSGLVNVETNTNNILSDVADACQIESNPNDSLINIAIIGIFIANTIPAMLLGTIAGVWTDRWPKRKLMVSSNGLRALLVLSTPICLISGPNLFGLSIAYWTLVLLTFLESILTQFFAPAEQAAIPLLVPKKQLMAANSVYQATSMGATIIGFALGYPVLSILRETIPSIGIFRGEFLLLPFCYGIAAISISKITLREKEISKRQSPLLSELKEGLQILRQSSTIRNAMVHLVFLYSLLAALYVLSIHLAAEIESIGRSGFGTLLSMSGLGMAIGAMTLAQAGHKVKRRNLSTIGLGIISWSLVLLAQLQGSLVLTLIMCSALGIGSALVAIPSQTTLQEETPETQRGKVFGLQNNLINIALSIPLVLAGALVSKYGLTTLLVGLAIISLIAALLERPWRNC